MPNTCCICRTPITVATAYSTPDDRHAPTGYGKTSGIANIYTCKREECKARARRQAGVKEERP